MATTRAQSIEQLGSWSGAKPGYWRKCNQLRRKSHPSRSCGPTITAAFCQRSNRESRGNMVSLTGARLAVCFRDSLFAFVLSDSKNAKRCSGEAIGEPRLSCRKVGSRTYKPNNTRRWWAYWEVKCITPATQLCRVPTRTLRRLCTSTHGEQS